MSIDLALPLSVAETTPEDTRAAAYLRQLLRQASPLADVAAIARRPGVQSKVAVRGGAIAGDVLARLREELGGERIENVRYTAEPREYIAAALGLQEPPPMLLKPHIHHAEVFVGDIDLLGLNGWRSINRLLASALTGWRIHLRPISDTAAWRTLAVAMAERRPVIASVLGPALLEVRGLHARVRDRRGLQVGDEVRVRVLRMNADEGTIRVSRRLAATGQLALPQ